MVQTEKRQSQLKGRLIGQRNDCFGKRAIGGKDKGLAMSVAHPTSGGVSRGKYQGFDLSQCLSEALVGLNQLFLYPIGGPTDEVGSEESKLLLDLHSNGGAN